jgi:hypothetical protein
MGDPAIGTAGLVLAIPGVIDLTIKYGHWIHGRYKTWKDPKGVWDELGKFGWSLAEGELNTLVAKSFSLDEGCDAGFKHSLDLQIRKLQADVETTKNFLMAQNPEK